MKHLFATTSRGFEELLKVELTELGAQDAKVVQGGVHYQADDETFHSRPNSQSAPTAGNPGTSSRSWGM